MTTKQDKKPVPFINETSCDEEVYKKGSVFEILDIPKEKANEYCIKLSSEDPSCKYDWHYFGGRVVVKRLEREFLRKEEKEKKTDIVQAYIVYEDGYTPYQLTIRLSGNNIEQDYFSILHDCLSDSFDEMNHPFIKGNGKYIFNIELKSEQATFGCRSWFDFELIDFKPLEK